MLGSILAAQQAKKETTAVQAGHLEASSLAAAGSFSALIVDDLNDEVRQVYETQKLLEREAQLLKRELAGLTQELARWSNKTQALLEALKTVGDLEHYSAVLRREAAALAAVLPAAVEAAAAAAGAAPEAAGEGAPEPGAQGGSSDSGAAGPAGQPPAAFAGPAADAADPPAAGTAEAQQQAAEPSLAQLPVSKRAFR